MRAPLVLLAAAALLAAALGHNDAASAAAVDAEGGSAVSASGGEGSSSGAAAPAAPAASAHAHTHEDGEDEKEEDDGGSELFMCRVCGATLFYTSDHIPGHTALSGPRAASVRPEPSLGREGALWEVVRSGGPSTGTITTALFHTSSGAVMTGAGSEAPAFGGYTQRQAVCTRCGNAVGWRFDRIGGTAGAAGAAAGGAGAGGPAPIYPASSARGAAGSGQRSAAGASDEDLLILQQQQPGAAGGAAAAAAAAAAPAGVIPYVEGEEAFRLSSLDGTCLTLPKGWWTFQLCHRKRANQFHRDPDGTVAPDWSLGDFDASGRVERARPISAAAGYYASHFYTGGQRCDETGRGRASEVQFFCCPYSRSTTAPFLEEVDEPATCKYRIKVCVPQLCAAGALPAPTPTPTAASSLSSSSARPSSSLAGADAAGADAAGAGGAIAGGARPTTSAARDRAEIAEEEEKSAAAAAAAGAEGAPSPRPSSRPPAAQSGAQATRTPFPRPAYSYTPETMPQSFFAAAWNLILGDRDPTYVAVAEGELVASIAPVRFA